MKKKAGFTLVEIMIVVAIIGLLAAIAVPSFVRARTTSQTNSCVNNLRQIEGAKDQYAIENNAVTGDAAPDGTLDGTTAGWRNYVKAEPLCPVGAGPDAPTDYTIGVVGTDVACNQFDAAAHNAAL